MEDTLTKRVIFALLVIVAGSIPASAKYSGGSGVAGDPYRISSVSDLLTLADTTLDYDKYFLLTADINLDPHLPGRKVFTTAVIASNFKGVFDGAMHKISNLTIIANDPRNDYLALFGCITGEIKNLSVENIYITGGGEYSYYIGGLAGANSGKISNCHTTGAITASYTSFYIGGLVGLNSGSIADCYSKVFTSGRESEYVGGLVGFNQSNISNCYSTGDVNGPERSIYVGGFAGANYGSHIAAINNCYSTGNIIGDNYNYVGGLVGLNGGTFGDYGIISNSYSTGNVAATLYRYGGLVGYNYNVINQCYFLDVAGPNNGYGTPLTDSQMKQQSSFAGWDFNTVWNICEGADYPKLLWQNVLCLPLSYSGGSGQSNNPYQIATSANLLTLANDINDYNKCFILTADINLDANLSGNKIFNDAVIASVEKGVFTGVFDGAGHKITNLDINTNGLTKEYLGLFGYVSGRIKNLGLENIFISAGDRSYVIGGLAGYVHDGNISSCYSTGSIISGDNSAALGGLVGRNDSGDINNCCSSIAVTGGSYIGGLVGNNFKSRISHCDSTGNILGHNYTGGMLGNNWECSIDDCCSTGTVTGGNYVGGFVGDNDSSDINNSNSTGNTAGGSLVGGFAGYSHGGAVSNCYSTGDVNGSSGTGGFIGWNTDTLCHCFATCIVNGVEGAGGLAGSNSGPISYCSSSGYVTGLFNIGGLAGDNGSSISNCCSTDNVTGGDESGPLGGLIGDNWGTLSICYSTGNVTGGNESYFLGGLAGHNGNNIDNCYSTGTVSSGNSSWGLGGLVGFNEFGNITHCYSIGTVNGETGPDGLGGLVGYTDGGISSDYFLITSGPDNGFGIPLTDTQMKQQSSFVGWDFTTIWAICEGTNYPRLLWSIPAADLVCPDGVNFADYSFFAQRWLNTNCASKDNCDGTDFDFSGTVNLADLKAFCNYWLQGL